MLNCAAQYCRFANQKGVTMLKKALVATAVAATLAPAIATAAESSPHTLTGNAGFFSQYIFRGLNQTDKEPAFQGGFDYSHANGFYLGTWASNVSWLRDFGGYSSGGSLEWDFYGGYKGTFGKSDFGYDVGLLQYWYPGTVASGANKADTLEVYGAITWKWLTAKLSYALSDEVFGVGNADGTYYLDLSANIPLADKFALQLHYGDQKFTGNTGGVDNDSFASYSDIKIGVTYSLPKDFTVGAFYTDTSMDSTATSFYTNASGRFIGKDTFTVFIQKTF
jgi:uncharacterized protein (TIGR02001 family)